jgi:class 3 adenylate cyclase
LAQNIIAPSLADLADGSAGPIPIRTVVQWAASDKSETMHRHLLAPYVVRGTIVHSDSVGLSKLTRERSLSEVLHLIDEPKQVICSYGVALGGRPLGIWAADNSEMFYGDDIEPQAVVEHMVCAQREIRALELQVGLGIHTGEFISFGDTMFGDDADLCDELTELYTGTGEIPLTERTTFRLDASFQARLRPHGYPRIPSYSLNYDEIDLYREKDWEAVYPIPYTADFHHYIRTEYLAECTHPTYRKYTTTKTVITAVTDLPARTFLLDRLTDLALSNAAMKAAAQDDTIEIIKAAGALGIFVTDDPRTAVRFALELREAMTSNGYQLAIGISQGEVLIFPLDDGGKEIAGGPVNISSKLAHDLGTPGALLIDSTIEPGEIGVSESRLFDLAVSQVTISGIGV